MDARRGAVSLDRLSLSRGFVLTLKGVDQAVRERCMAVAVALAEEHPALPGALDAAVRLDPVGLCWAREVPGTIWSVLYTVGARTVFVRSINAL